MNHRALCNEHRSIVTNKIYASERGAKKKCTKLKNFGKKDTTLMKETNQKKE